MLSILALGGCGLLLLGLLYKVILAETQTYSEKLEQVVTELQLSAKDLYCSPDTIDPEPTLEELIEVKTTSKLLLDNRFETPKIPPIMEARATGARKLSC